MFSAEANFVYIATAAILILIFLVVVIIVFVYAYRQRLLAYAAEKQQIKMNFEQEMLKTSIEMKDETMKAIGIEIHDNICQTLGLVRLTLNTMHFDETPDPEKVKQSQDLVGKALVDLRSLSKSLDNESVMNAGLGNALRFELERLQRTGVFKTYYLQEDDIADIDPQKEMMIFRMVQESLANIVKHAQASEVQVEVGQREKGLSITVVDNGIGYAEATSPKTMDSGSGLRNMRNRAALLGGHFNIEARAQGGTAVEIMVPIQGNA